MEKFKVDISYDFLSINEDTDSSIHYFEAKSLSDTVKYFVPNDREDSYFCFSTNDDLSDKKVRLIAQKLASAIDKNSVEDIKSLKIEYGKEEGFVAAKKFLNKKCKEIWNVYEPSNVTVPIEAMKVLGITNKPSLDSLLYESVKYFEQDNGVATANIINSILNNKNLNYTIEEIHNYLVSMYKKENCKFNFKTAKYLIEKHNYTLSKLCDLGLNKEFISKVFNELSWKNRIKFRMSGKFFFMF